MLDYERLRRYVEDKLKEDWSPEQIAGRLPIDFPDHGRTRVSHETIYAYVYADKRAGGTLYTHLRQGHKQRFKRFFFMPRIRTSTSRARTRRQTALSTKK